MEQREPVAGGLRDYLRVLRRRKGIVGIALLVVVGTTILAAELQVPIYQANAQVLLKYQSAAQSVFNPNTGQPNDPTREVQNQLQVITSQPIKQAVQDQLGRVPSIVAVAVGQTDVIDITAHSTDPRGAATIANAYANAYIKARQTREVNDALASATQVKNRIDDLQQQIDALNAQVNGANAKNSTAVGVALGPQLQSLSSQQAVFKQQLAELQFVASLGSAGAQLVTPAKVPVTPASPRPARDVVIAIAAGLVLGVGAAFLLDQLDDSLQSTDDLERAAPGLANLAVIPTVGGWRNKAEPMVVSIKAPQSPSAEAYRSLRTSIQFASFDRPLRSLQITSPSQSEGKTTTVANLGVALAQVGQQVILVCCDLRRPRLHEFFGLDNTVGFTSVLLGEVPASSALQDVPGIYGLRILPSGPVPSNPAELLSSARAAEVLTTLLGTADMVIIDSPPVLPVTDAAVIAGLVDATVLVLTAGSTTRRQTAEAIERLEQVNPSLLATILNRVTRGDTYDYAYYPDKGSSPRRWDIAGLRRPMARPSERPEAHVEA